MMTLKTQDKMAGVPVLAGVAVMIGMGVFALYHAEDWFVQNSQMPRAYVQAMTVACAALLVSTLFLPRRLFVLPLGVLGVMLMSAPSLFNQPSLPETMLTNYVNLVVTATAEK